MRFKTFDEFYKHLEEKGYFNDDIRGKRLRKELKNLSELSKQELHVHSFEVLECSMLISVTVQLAQIDVRVGNKIIPLNLRLDCEYPFNQPQIWYLGHAFPEYKYCKDLLQSMIKEEAWGPSMVLATFLDRFAELAVHVSLRQGLMINGEPVQWSYHRAYPYAKEELERAGVKLVDIELYKWKYMVKHTKHRVLGMTDDSFLLLSEAQGSPGTLKLEHWEFIRDVQNVKATKKKDKFHLEFEFAEEGKKEKLHLGGDVKELPIILESMNPIQMIEHRVQGYQKSPVTDYDGAIRDYSALIEHYSMTDKEKSQKYMQEMKKVIDKQYGASQPPSSPPMQA